MAAVKLPAIFRRGIISESDSKFKGDVSFEKSLILSTNSSLTLPVHTRTTGRQFEVRLNPTDGNMEVYDTNGWRPPFKSSLRYDSSRSEFVAEDSDGNLYSFLAVKEGGSLSGVSSLMVDPGDGPTHPAVRFKGFPNSGLFGDPANGWTGLAVNGKAILTAKGSGLVVKRHDEQGTFLLDIQKTQTTLRSNLRVEGDTTVTGQLDLNGQVISQNNISGYSDKRLKEVLGEYTKGVECLDGLQLYRYHNTKTGENEFGPMAQDLFEIEPDLVSTHNGLMMVNHYPMIKFLLAMVIDLKNKLGE